MRSLSATHSCHGPPVTNASLCDGPGPSEGLVPSGRARPVLGMVAVLCALITGLVVGVRSQDAAPGPVDGGALSPTEQRPLEDETRPEVTVQGLGTLPSLAVLWRWELGEGQPMIADVSEDLAVSGRGARGFGLMRISDGQPPTVVGVAPAGDMNFAMFGAGGRRFITIGSGGWKGDGSYVPARSEIFDSADPAHPRKVGEIILETDSQFVRPWGDYMLIGESRVNPTPLGGSLRIFQMVGDDAGKEVGRLEGATRPIAVDGDRAYVVRSCGGRVQPTAPPLVVPDIMQPPPMMMGYDPAFPDCLAVVDLSDPSRPESIGERPMPDTGSPTALATYGGYVYMPMFGEGVLVADARGAGAPVLLDARPAKGMQWQMLLDNFSPGGHLDVVVNGSVLYFGYHTTIVAFDLTTPAAPKPVAAIQLGPEGYIDRLILTNNRLYVSTGDPTVASSYERFALWVIAAPASPADLLRWGGGRCSRDGSRRCRRSRDARGGSARLFQLTDETSADLAGGSQGLDKSSAPALR